MVLASTRIWTQCDYLQAHRRCLFFLTNNVLWKCVEPIRAELHNGRTEDMDNMSTVFEETFLVVFDL